MFVRDRGWLAVAWAGVARRRIGGVGGVALGGNGTEDLLGTNEARVEVARSEQAVVTDLEELVRENVQELCGGADYVARPSAIRILPQR